MSDTRTAVVALARKKRGSRAPVRRRELTSQRRAHTVASAGCVAGAVTRAEPETTKLCVVEPVAPNWSVTVAVTEYVPGAANVCRAAGVVATAPSENCKLVEI